MCIPARWITFSGVWVFCLDNRLNQVTMIIVIIFKIEL